MKLAAVVSEANSGAPKRACFKVADATTRGVNFGCARSLPPRLLHLANIVVGRLTSLHESQPNLTPDRDGPQVELGSTSVRAWPALWAGSSSSVPIDACYLAPRP